MRKMGFVEKKPANTEANYIQIEICLLFAFHPDKCVHILEYFFMPLLTIMEYKFAHFVVEAWRNFFLDVVLGGVHKLREVFFSIF